MLIIRDNKACKQKESYLVRACIDYLTLKKAVVIRNNTAHVILESNGKKRSIRTGSPGSPDIIAFLPEGRVLCIECKTEKGRLSDKQKEFAEKLQKNGHIVAVVRSLDDLEKLVP